MRFSQQVPRIAKLVEGVKLVAYQDGGGVWTIGAGHTLNVTQGMRISPEQVDVLLRQDLMVCDAAIKRLVTIDLTQPVLDALGLFVLNIGTTAFAESTLLRLLNGRQFEAALYQLHRWNHDNGKVEHGLTVRRLVEALVWKGCATRIDAQLHQAIILATA